MTPLKSYSRPTLDERRAEAAERHARTVARAQRNAVNRGAKAGANVRSVEEVQAEIAGRND